ncbi:family 10 glycosylhydrolase [Carboxylicivirga sp. RSCT41]|uniref:family 10 glycosylhydrolase n=1 Tax=Carboxylicivirga agarovorans TaxID=3417570 RepID=UPI003D358064
MRGILLCLCMLLLSVGVMAQSGPKREMRSTWLTTVWGLDWPSSKIPSTGDAYYISQQKNQLINLLNKLQEANINTVFFQVRSECDAMYESSYEPWSSHLVATRGLDPGYDPLEFAIEEAHKRGMELHAWLNPYRFESSVGKYDGAAGDYRQTNPEWVLEYPDKSDGSKNVSILDPGNPGVRTLIVNIVKEIIQNYDVDGITFDDYFYAYGGTPGSLDSYSQGLYKPSGMDLHDWRRDNVNKMVADVYQVIQNNEPWVTFGLSPFGIWTTDSNVAASEGIELPQGITGMNAYQDIYCDPVAWLKEGTVDYISPQIYWPTTSAGQDYDVLSPWWSDVCNRFHRHLYVSHSLSGLEASSYSAALKSEKKEDLALELNGMSLLEYLSFYGGSKLKLAPTEYGKQIQVNRDADKNGAPGSVFFRTQNFFVQGFVNYLKSYEYQNMSIAPAINWKQAEDRALVTNIRLEGNDLLWDSQEDNVRFVVYAIPNEDVANAGNTFKAECIVGISYGKSFDLSARSELISTHKFAVAVLDRYGNEFPTVLMGHSPSQNVAADLTFPANGQDVFLPFSFAWDAVSNAEGYQVEVASDVSFNNIIYKRDVETNSFEATNVSMTIGQTYYWRVTSRMLGVTDLVSATFSFTLVDEPKCVVISPANNATGISQTPTIEWNGLGLGYVYEVQIALNSDFSTIHYQAESITATQADVPVNKLTASTHYYLRVRGISGRIVSAWSDLVSFTTVDAIPDVPVILTPSEGAVVGSGQVVVEMAEEPRAKSFTMWLSKSSTFPWTDRKVLTIPAFTYEGVYSDLELTSYYVKVRANYGSSSYTAWSATRSFDVVATAIDDVENKLLHVDCPTILRRNAETISYFIPESGKIRLVVYDLMGKELAVLVNDYRSAGKYTAMLQAGALKKGIYLLMLECDTQRKTIKVIKQ